jgi:hypothetical protein
METTGHFAQFFTDDVTWTTIDTNDVVRGPQAVQDFIVALHARMSDAQTHRLVFSEDCAYLEGSCAGVEGRGVAHHCPLWRFPFRVVLPRRNPRPDEGRPAVAEIVKPDPAHAGRVAQLAEPLGHLVAVQRRAVLVSEDEPVVRVCVAPLGTFSVLAEPVLEEEPGRLAVQLDDPRVAAGGLRRPEEHLPVCLPAVRAGMVAGDLHQLLPHDEAATVNIDVGPPQRKRLAST